MSSSWLWTAGLAAVALVWIVAVLGPQFADCGKQRGTMVRALTVSGYACMKDAR